MARIHLLPDRLISQIAAGEVVERPASVLKELVENALDAGATSVEIDLVAGGKRLVGVSDDGSGMGRDDALLAFDRHATSKIAAFEDLERVATLGFRGEALASIAAVAKLEMRTAEEAGDGQRVRIEGGRILGSEAVPHGRGTQIEVRSLFFNVPARRQFLKKPQTELRRCLEVAQGYVLARPDVHFVLRHEGRELLMAPPAGEGAEAHRERISQIFGASLGRHLRSLEGDPRIGGFLGDRETARGGRRLFVFVNRRLLRDRALLAVFYRAVRATWKSEEFPALFLFLELPPEEVDVNVHPQKAEVRFRDPFLLAGLGEVLRHALEQSRGEEPAPLGPPLVGSSAALPPPAWEGAGGRPAAGPSYAGKGWQRTDEVAEGALPGGRQIAEVVYAPLAPTARVPLSGRSGSPGGGESLRLLGQYKGTLILLEGPSALYLIDQHVAHERILYERLRSGLEGERLQLQRLLQPVLLELGLAEAQALGELSSALEECGFHLAPMSGGSVAVSALPDVVSVDEGERLLLALATRAADASELEPDPGDLRRHLLDALAASQACRSAVKMHHPLSVEEMQSLVSELFVAENPYACPHGRPIVLTMSDVDLERRFGRR